MDVWDETLRVQYLSFPLSVRKLDTCENPSLKPSQNQNNTVASLNSYDFAEVEQLVVGFKLVSSFRTQVWVLPSGHIYHDHLLKHARIALGTSLQDHIYRQNTRIPMYDIFMHSQALQENTFGEVWFRVHKWDFSPCFPLPWEVIES